MKINQGSVLVISLALLSFLTALTASGQDKWKGTIVKEGDVTLVKNPKEPLYKTPVLELKEDLSLGGAEAQGDYAFGEVRTFVVDEAGSIYVLDSQASHVKVFDKVGKYVRTIGRQGQGPGELESPMTLSFNRTSGELAVHQASRRMSYFKTDGTFLRHLSLKEMWALRGRVDSKGNIYITEGIIDQKDPRYELKKLAPDASFIALLAKSPAPNASVKFNPFMAISYFQLDRADNLVYGYPETYEIQVFGADNLKVARKFTREYDPVTVTAEEKAEREKDFPSGMTVNFDFSKYHSAYTRFFLSDLGHVIVQTWEKTKDGKFVHDIFDAEGRFIGRVPLKPSGVEILKGKYYALEED
ncbi:MAG TPA: 6-bladed beta-propeller, partial [Candidatus Latescibacteria bacterium]|nr:6-bladed beta-propeller [Candidatus Latescibacterota bacterium]